jgi:hypothetical protein
MKVIEKEIFDILAKKENKTSAAKAIYRKLLKYSKKCNNDDCKYCREYVCTFKSGYTISCSNSKRKEVKK